MADDDVTKAQAAALLGCHVATVHAPMARGVLPSRRIGFIHLLRRADVLAYRARQAGQDAGEPLPASLAAADADEVTVSQAAALLGVTVGAVHAAMKRGALPHRRVGSCYAPGRSDVTAYWER